MPADSVIAVLDLWCKESKKICAVCKVDLKNLTPPKDFQGRLWQHSVMLKHPTKKSKRFKLCGTCYKGLKHIGAPHEDSGKDQKRI